MQRGDRYTQGDVDGREIDRSVMEDREAEGRVVVVDSSSERGELR